MNIFKRFLTVILKFLSSIVFSNPKLRTLLYEMRNQKEFGNLYEHEKMLADSIRINSYRRAIVTYVGPEDVVLDLGTGTGILAFFAARQKPKKIIAIDHSDFINVAKKIARHNKFENIEFVQSNSRDFAPDVMFDIIIHEQMGDYLFNENMVANILDLKKRLLKPAGRIFPGKFELYLEPVCLKESFAVPFLWENQLHDIDFKFLESCYETLNEYKPSGYEQEWLDADAVNHFLCEPSPVLTFDLNDLHSEKDIPRLIKASKEVVTAGSFDSFCLFFKTIFDEEIDFSTSPLTPNTHWGNCFFRIDRRKCTGREVINFELFIEDPLDIKTWSVAIK